MRGPAGAGVSWMQLAVRVGCRLGIVACCLRIVLQLLSIINQVLRHAMSANVRGSTADVIASALSRSWTSIAFWITAAGVLWLVQGRLLRWIVPMPEPTCPGCGHAVDDDQPARCNECGCRLD